MDDKPNIQDGEIVETVANEANDNSTLLLSLDQLIKTNIAAIEKIREQLKLHRQMFADSFTNDPTYKELEDKAKEATRVKLSTKQQIVKQPSISQLAQKLKDLSSDLKERTTSLSDYLLEYQRISGATEIEGEDGELRKIVSVARLVKQSEKKNR